MKDITDFVDEVKENGYKKVPELLDSDFVDELRADVMKAFKKAKKNFYHTHTDYVRVLSIQKSDTENIKYFKFLNQFFNNTFLQKFIKNYFDSEEIIISKIFLAESSNSGEEVDVLPYKLHFDKTRYLKFMIYLSDVDIGDGGITFANSEWNTKLQKELLSKKALMEENVVEVDDLSKIEEITGPSGTGVIFDTNVTHKAGQVLGENKRLVLRIDTTTKI